MAGPAPFVTAFVTLLVVVEPFGLGPIFITASGSLAAPARSRLALRASAIALAILAGAALIGQQLLQGLGISLAAFRIGGGLLLFSIASEMVLGLRIARDAHTAEQALGEPVRDPAVFPLAMPMMAGPGAIAAELLLAGRAQGDPLALATLLAATTLVMAICLGVCLFAIKIAAFLGASGEVLLAKLLGVLLAALAVQYVIDGVRDALAG